MKKIFSLIITISIVSILAGCSPKATKDPSSSKDPVAKTDYFMGTYVKITLYDHQEEQTFTEVFDRVKQIEERLSINEEGTEIDKVNEAAGVNAVEVSEDAFINIKEGLEYSRLTQGSFDITIGPLVKLWSIGLPEAKVPTQAEIEQVLPLTNYQDVVLDEEASTVYLKNKGMMIDLGSIAKGYTADVIAEILKEKGVQSALIDLGGNVFALGSHPEERPWNIGIQNPYSNRGEIIGYLPIENRSVVTSGVYERYIEQDDKKYHHILNPLTGYPYDNEILGVTIISDKSIDGDALSTSVFSKGLQGGMEFIETQSNIEAIFITKENKVYLTSGIKDSFVLQDNSFTITE